MLLFMVIGPVSHNPRGIMTVPPPSAAHFSMALRIASVFIVIPSPIAPKSLMFNVWLGIVGCCISGISKGSCSCAVTVMESRDSANKGTSVLKLIRWFVFIRFTIMVYNIKKKYQFDDWYF